MTLVRLGRIGRPHGLEGEVSLDGCDLTAPELQELGRFTWRGAKGETRSLHMRAARPAHTRLLVHFEGVHDRESAGELTNGELLIEAERLPDAGPGQAYYFQLIGLRVSTEDGRLLGTLADIFPTGAHPIYVVRGERELMIPAIPEIVKKVDFAAGTMTVVLPAGLEEATAS